MNQKSITFRCSESQNDRLNAALSGSGITRSDFICEALENFLNYTEQNAVRQMDLFELVQDVDAHGSGPSFAEQA